MEPTIVFTLAEINTVKLLTANMVVNPEVGQAKNIYTGYLGELLKENLDKAATDELAQLLYFSSLSKKCYTAASEKKKNEAGVYARTLHDMLERLSSRVLTSLMAAPSLGFYLLSAEKYEQAIAYLEEAIITAGENNLPVFRSCLQLQLSRAFIKAGDATNGTEILMTALRECMLSPNVSEKATWLVLNEVMRFNILNAAFREGYLSFMTGILPELSASAHSYVVCKTAFLEERYSDFLQAYRDLVKEAISANEILLIVDVFRDILALVPENADELIPDFSEKLEPLFPPKMKKYILAYLES